MHTYTPRASSLFPLLLFTFLALGRPATAQKEVPQLAVRTAAYKMYPNEAAPVVKEEASKVTIPIKVSPNPTTGSFKARLYGSREEQVRIEILDQFGRVIDARLVSAGAELRFGYWYEPGTYFLHIVQGENRKKVKLIKLAE